MLKSAANHLAHVVMEGLVGIAGVVAIAGCILAWRLAQGPIDITRLAQREQAALAGAGSHLSVGHAALAWEGFHDPSSALDIRLSEIRLSGPDNTLLLSLPSGRVTLSLPQLLLGRIVPRAIVIDDATVRLQRTADGRLVLDLNGESGGQTRGGNEIMSELARPARNAADRQPSLPWLSQLHSVSIRNAHVTVSDAAWGLVWQAPSASADLTRQPDGGVLGDARLDLVVGPVHATLSAHAALTGQGTHVIATITPINPARLATVSQAFAAAAAIDAPIQTQLDATLAPDLSPRSLTLNASLGAGSLHAGTGALPIQSADIELAATPDRADLRSLHLALAALPGQVAPPPRISATAHFARAPGRIDGGFTADVSRMEFSDLPAYWPTGTTNGAREWVTRNITAGTIQGGHFTGTLDAEPDFANARLRTLAGSLSARNMTLWWLRPIPPVEHADARLVFDSPDALRIFISGGQQKDLRLGSGTMRISGLTAKDQIGQIEASLTGALPDALSLLAHPRLNLLSRLPFPVVDPAGQFTTHLAIKLKLDDRVTMDEITIGTESELSGVHLGRIAAGEDLDHGQLTLNVDTNGLTLAGDATVAKIPSHLALDMDFRAGPPTQIMQHVIAKGTATGADLARAGLPPGLLTAGTAQVRLDYTAYRNTTADLALSADLANAAVQTPLAWSKAQGAPATVTARVKLDHGRISAMDDIHAVGPGLMIDSSLSADKAGRKTLHIDALRIGRSDLHGTIGLPSKPADPWAVRLTGPTLDLSAYLQKTAAKTDETKTDNGDDLADEEQRGPAWSADLAFSKVILAQDATATEVSLTAASDGLHIAHARLDADQHRIAASITQVAGGRHLAINAADAGAVLLAANVFDNIRGGQLLVDANYADTQPHAPLSGTATLQKFRLLDAPAIGRLLKAMTLYGAVDLLHGPGLGFSKAVAPFAWKQRVLSLKNARAFSASLGLTAQGDIDLRHHDANLTGTIVPAYFFNQLPGNLPVVGRFFSPEKGGGVFAARYSVKGKLADPKIGLNPLSALTPGFLRGVFGIL
jgi:hypothetical protein